MKSCNLFFILFNILYISYNFKYVSAVETSDRHTNETNDIVISYENECRLLCESCDCQGFFCGDNECICECNANINVLNKYAECLKDIIKDNFYKYNISVQYVNAPSNDLKKSEMSKTPNDNKTIKKRSIAWEIHPEGTNLEKEKIFMVDSKPFQLPQFNFDTVGSPFSGLKGLGDSLSLPNLASTFGNTKGQDVAAQAPSILAAPAKDQVSSPPATVAAPAPSPSVGSPQKDAQIDSPVSSTNSIAEENNVGLAVKAKTAIKAIEIGKLSGLLGKIKGIKLKSLVKGGLLGDAQDGAVGATAPIITQPTQTR